MLKKVGRVCNQSKVESCKVKQSQESQVSVGQQ